MPNIHELIRDHVTLSIRCLDRLYLHAYMPKLQTSGGLCYFLRDHLGHPIPSPALFAPGAQRKSDFFRDIAGAQSLSNGLGFSLDFVLRGGSHRRRVPVGPDEPPTPGRTP